MSSQMRAPEASNLESNVFDIRVQAEEVVKTANLVKDIANEVATGAVSQVVSLDSALDRSNQLTNTLKETADQAASIITSVEELSASITESGTSIEQTLLRR